jgi:hypothetical protein
MRPRYKTQMAYDHEAEAVCIDMAKNGMRLYGTTANNDGSAQYHFCTDQCVRLDGGDLVSYNLKTLAAMKARNSALGPD